MTTLRLEADGDIRWSIDGQSMGEVITLNSAQRRLIEETSRQFLTLFEQERRPLLPPDVLRSIGRQLFSIFWEPVWDTLCEQLAGPVHELVLVSQAL